MSMRMEKKFREALLKVLTDKVFKNLSALCGAAGVDQGGINTFINTMKFRAGECAEPNRLKDNLNLDVVSKLIDAMGGELVFPWESPEVGCRSELEKIKLELERKNEIIRTLTAEKDLLRDIIRDISGKDAQPDEPRQNKSCA